MIYVLQASSYHHGNLWSLIFRDQGQSLMNMTIHILTNFVVIYIRRRRIIIDSPDVKFFIVIMMYYNAMDWVSVGWLVELSGARPLHQCLVSYTSTFFHFLDTIVLFYAFTGQIQIR